jgi:hypothetical protein
VLQSNGQIGVAIGGSVEHDAANKANVDQAHALTRTATGRQRRAPAVVAKSAGFSSSVEILVS